MSYDIIKKIKITEDKKVLITCASNNVCPRTFEEVESFSLSKILKEEGKDKLDLEILKAYESGCFQRGSNKYTRALHILRHLPEYENFNWRINGKKAYEKVQKKRETAEFDVLLQKALNGHLPEEKFILLKDNYGSPVYFRKLTKWTGKWTSDKEKAKIFNYKEDTERVKNLFTESKDWKIEEAQNV